MNLYEITITEGQRGLLYRHGVLVDFLRPGRHRHYTWSGGYDTTVLALADIAIAVQTDLLVALEGRLPAADGRILEVPPDHALLVRHGGVPKAVLTAGRHLVWGTEPEVTTAVIDLAPLRTQLPVDTWSVATSAVFYEALVQGHERAVLYVDGVLTEVLEPGRYGLTPWRRQIRLTRVDMREQELQVQGQELVTRDKVSLRLNLVAHYRVVDPQRLVTALESLRDAVYAAVQVAARQAVSGATVDELLAERAQVAVGMVQAVAARAVAWGVELLDLDIKDVILPGEMKSLMNQVIEAEKRAAAQVILRREEVAATRSLANTARLLEQNPVLLRLKELETWKELAERVPKLTVMVAAEGLAKQLRLSE